MERGEKVRMGRYMCERWRHGRDVEVEELKEW